MQPAIIGLPTGTGRPPMPLHRLRGRAAATLRRPLWAWQQTAAIGGGSGGAGGGGSAAAQAKRRGKAASADAPAEEASAVAAASAQTPEVAAAASAADPAAQPPLDLSKWAPRGAGWEPASLPQQWVVFSDLHVSHRTKRTCLAVLECVHEEAAARGAGILFLGDFWHTRGTLPVEPLNDVVARLTGWQQPTLMLPGNHDQVSLGGEVHALTPLAAANPAIHAFDGPTLFLDALWLPYRRDRTELEAVLAAARAGTAKALAGAGSGSGGGSEALVQAVFAHADIIGASLNEAYQAHDGLPPKLFPPALPTYTGHYHKPHTVPGTRITYIGSPYQVSRAEAGQQKRLLLLDRASGWQVADELMLDVGPRYFSATAVPAVPQSDQLSCTAAAEAGEALEAAAAGEEGAVSSASDGEATAAEVVAEGQLAEPEFELHLPEGLRPGDRLLLTLPAAAAKQHQRRLKKLEKQGVEVEVYTPPAAKAAPRLGPATEGLGPLQMWERYCDWQRLPEAAAAAGSGLLQRLLLEASGREGGLEERHTSIRFDAVEVEGYFSFREAVRYDLAQRGLVVVTGQVLDTSEAGVESNGAGKTALMMAPLWAITGTVDSRAEGASAARPLLSDIINDDSKRARVRVEGTVGGTPFVVERSANKKASSVSFWLAGEELTTQENRLTQQLIDTHLGADLLGRVVFYGQSDITALLEATDRSFKQELSKLVDLEVWAKAKEASRSELAARRASLHDAEATLRERQHQAAALSEQLASLEEAAAGWEQQAAGAAAVLRREAAGLLGSVRARQEQAQAALQRADAELKVSSEKEVKDLEGALERCRAQLADMERQLEQQGNAAADSQAAAERLQQAQAAQREAQRQLQAQLVEVGAAESGAAAAERQLQHAREQAGAAQAALAAFLQRNSSLSGQGSAVTDVAARQQQAAATAQRLEALVAEEEAAQDALDEAEEELAEAQVDAARHETRAGDARQRAERAQHEAQAAQQAAQQAQQQAGAAAEGKPSLAESKQELKGAERRLALARQRLGTAQGQAAERQQQLEAFVAMAASGQEQTAAGGAGGSKRRRGSKAASGGSEETAVPSSGVAVKTAAAGGNGGSHEHAPGTAVCDRCQQPISQLQFEESMRRLQQAAATAATVAEQAAAEVDRLAAAVDELEAGLADAERREQQQAEVSAAAAAAAAAEASAATAAAEAEAAEAELAVLTAAVEAAEQDVQRWQRSVAQLGFAFRQAQQQAELEQEAARLQAASEAAAAGAAEVERAAQQAEERRRGAEAALFPLQEAADAAAEAAGRAQRAEQETGDMARRVSSLRQEEALLLSRQEQLRQQARRLETQCGALRNLSGSELPAMAARLAELAGGEAEAAGSWQGGQTAAEAEAETQADTTDAEAVLTAATSAALSSLATAAELQQRWALQQGQPNLPARDAALVRGQLEAAARQQEEVERRLSELEDEVDDAFLPRGVVNFVVEGVLGDLQEATSRNLSALTSGMALTLSPCKPSKSKKDGEGVIEQIEKTVYVRQPGGLEMRPRSVRQLSGGERRRVALALALGFSELAAQRGRLRSNLVVLDEVMQHLDGEGCLRVAQLLKQLPYESILVVAQAHSLLTQAFDATDVVVKTGGHSRVEMGSTAAVS